MSRTREKKRRRRRGNHLLVVGAGGNIGSHLVPHLARLPEVSRLTLIDRDRYESGNVAGQNVTTRELGKAKARAMAARARAIRPELDVSAVVAPVESLPLGRLRADVLLTGLDSRRARQAVSLAALRLGVRWIDAGVKGDDWLARATCYLPGPGEACLECAWDGRDYRHLQEEFPCGPGTGSSPVRTGAASFVGALAASLQAALCQKHLDGRFEAGFQVLVDARHHKHHVTRFVRNQRCRVDPHGPLEIRPVRATAGGLTLGEAFSLARYRLETSRLRVEGKAFARALTCRTCSVRRETLRLLAPGTSSRRRCRRCRGAMETAGLDVADTVSLSELSSRFLGSRLARLGFRDGEVFTVTGNGGEKHFELGR